MSAEALRYFDIDPTLVRLLGVLFVLSVGKGFLPTLFFGL